MAKVLVAGATGALGVELVDALAERGHEVLAMSRKQGDPRLEPHAKSISKTRVGDVAKPDTLPDVVEGAEVVVSTVGLTKPVHGVTFEEVDFQGNLNLLNAAAKAGVKRFSYVSAANIETSAADKVPVMVAKRRFEEELMKGPVPWSISRPSGFFWNYGVILGMAREHGAVWLFGDGNASSTPIHETDLAAAIADRIDLEGTAYTVGGPQDLTYNEVSEMIFRVLGREAKVHHLPAKAVHAGLEAMRPLMPSKYGLAAFAFWVMTHDATAERIGERRLDDWLAQNKDRDFGPI